MLRRILHRTRRARRIMLISFCALLVLISIPFISRHLHYKIPETIDFLWLLVTLLPLASLIDSFINWGGHALTTRRTLARFDRKRLEYELSQPTCRAYPEFDLYFTDRYLLSAWFGLQVAEYRSIALISVCKPEEERPGIQLYLIPEWKIFLPFDNSAAINWLIGELQRRNPAIMLGDTPENMERYHNMIHCNTGRYD